MTPLRAPGQPADEPPLSRNRAKVVLSATRLNKTYPGTVALRELDLQLSRGEIRALVGENGSGKSTLVGILGGKFRADPGATVTVDGRLLEQGDPAKARDAGISVIHQELTIIPQLSALENVFLGDLPRKGIRLDRSKMREEYGRLARRLSIYIPAEAIAGQLSISQQTMVEIMRAVRRHVKVLLLDEPTATLGQSEREALYSVVTALSTAGVACIWISHDLDEVFRVADTITVLRNGEHVRSADKTAWTKGTVVRAMLEGLSKPGASRQSAELESLIALGVNERAEAMVGSKSSGPREPILELSKVLLRNRAIIDQLEIRKGEILGIAGLVGSGRTSLLRAIAGVDPVVGGRILMEGRQARWPRSPREALKLGIALLPEDRKGQGLVLGMTAIDNITLTGMSAVARRGVLSKSAARTRATELLNPLAFRGNPRGAMSQLSGGNQQKVLIAKWLHVRPKVLLIDEPTRGIDVGAKQDIMAAMRALAAAGHAIVWVSSEIEEVAAVSDRVAIMSSGRITAEIHGRDVSTSSIVDHLSAA